MAVQRAQPRRDHLWGGDHVRAGIAHHALKHGATDGARPSTRGRRAAGREGEAYLTLHEEQLAVRKRAAPAGEVEVHKTVETQRVQETVPATREDVTLERRPLTGADATRGATIGEETIRVPLMAEQVVTEKRVVPTEEVVIRKQIVTENQTVEDTVRRERVDVDRSGLSGGASSGDTRR